MLASYLHHRIDHARTSTKRQKFSCQYAYQPKEKSLPKTMLFGLARDLLQIYKFRFGV